MNILKTVLKSTLKIFIIFFIFSLILSLIYYLGIINTKTFNYIRLISFIIILYFSSNKESKRLNKNNLLNSLLLGISIILIFLLIALITKYNINIKLFLYYLLILGISVLGSLKKKKR